MYGGIYDGVSFAVACRHTLKNKVDVIVNAWFRDNEIRGRQTGALRGYSYKHIADIPVILRRQEQYPH